MPDNLPENTGAIAPPGDEPAQPTPDHAQRRVFGATNMVLLVVAFLALIATAFASMVLSQRNREAFALSTRTETLLGDASRTLELLEDAETGQRGFLLTEKADYLQPYTMASARIPGDLDHLVAESQNLPVADLADEIRAKGLAKLAEVTHVLELYREGGRAEAMREVDTDIGLDLMSDIRALVQRLRVMQEAQLRERLDAAGRTGRILVTVQVGTVVLVLMISALTGIGLYQNIRALRRTQADLADTNLNLEQIVATRTSALSRANDEIQKFAYIVSHDLRAPLVNIMGFTSELETAAKAVSRYVESRVAAAPGEAPDEVVLAIREDVPEAFGFIKTSTAKMDRLIGAILRLSREGRRSMTPEPVAMRPLIETIASTLKHSADEKNATITVVDPLPNLMIDRLAVEQIFSNLLDNAVKYLVPGRPGVIVVRGYVKPPFAYFEVEDNGRGIAASDRERVFELFRRAGGQDVPGEGIGLAYVRQLVHRLGGAIELDSALARGAVFRLSFPLIQKNQQRESA
jgi:signal transduction histidine kinase